MIRLKGKEGERKNNWLLLKERDELARDDSGISDYTTSIRTGRTMAEIEEGRDDKVIKNPFDRAGVQLAKLVTEIPEGDDWLYELKYDGYRILAYVQGICTTHSRRFQSTPPAWGATATLSKNYLQSCCSLLFRTKPTKYQ